VRQSSIGRRHGHWLGRDGGAPLRLKNWHRHPPKEE
jgi:hypothetical protein